MVAISRAEISRRQFAGICIGTAAGAAMLDSVSQAGAQSISNAITSTVIDQNPIRRRGTGLRALDVARALPGLTLFSPMDGDGVVYLIDLAGKVVHTWKMPYPPGLYGYLSEKGTLFYNACAPAGHGWRMPAPTANAYTAPTPTRPIASTGPWIPSPLPPRPALAAKSIIGIGPSAWWQIVAVLASIVWKILHEGVRYIEQGSESDPKVRKHRARILARALRKLGYDVAITPINPATTEMRTQM